MAIAPVLTVGSVNVDRVVTVDRMPTAGETVIGGAPARLPGGKGGNQAVAAARLGARVACVACVGDDDDGALVRASLAGDGIDLTGVRTAADAPTGSAAVFVDAQSQNMIVVSRGANDLLTAEQAAGAVRDVRPGVVGLSLEIPLAAAVAAAHAAAQAGARVVANLSPSSTADAELAAVCDVVIVNEHEAAALLGDEVPAELSAAAASALVGRARVRGAHHVIVTRGAADTLLLDGHAGTFAVAPAYTVDPVDTTGCGDAFAGALMAGLAAGVSLAAACENANATAALAATGVGAQSSYPSRAAVDAFRAAS
ncbi:ribokinase [Microbacterium sp.]|uniref:ribokinase n=1 Tax=Microbacterium sp. TaxID=51671 RepID=UPI003A8BFE38